MFRLKDVYIKFTKLYTARQESNMRILKLLRNYYVYSSKPKIGTRRKISVVPHTLIIVAVSYC